MSERPTRRRLRVRAGVHGRLGGGARGPGPSAEGWRRELNRHPPRHGPRRSLEEHDGQRSAHRAGGDDRGPGYGPGCRARLLRRGPRDAEGQRLHVPHRERWLEVSPAKGSANLCLVVSRPERSAGIETGVVLFSSDVLADLAAVRAQGLAVDEHPLPEADVVWWSGLRWPASRRSSACAIPTAIPSSSSPRPDAGAGRLLHARGAAGDKRNQR